MATLTGGTKAGTTLTALQFPGPTGVAMSDADIATIALAILNNGAISPGAFSRMGLLYVPQRGILQLQPDDFVMVGPEGFPYLVPNIATALTLTVNGSPVNASPSMVMASSVIALGWKVGGLIAGTNIPAGTLISAISSDGLTITMSKNATGTPGAVTVTYGSFTHS